MLDGRKPFAHFADAKGRFSSVVERYIRLFDLHVRAGRLIRLDHFEPPSDERFYELHRIMFSLPGEEWRFQAFLDLVESPTWGPVQERREGELLGYDDWMNDHFLALKYRD